MVIIACPGLKRNSSPSALFRIGRGMLPPQRPHQQKQLLITFHFFPSSLFLFGSKRLAGNCPFQGRLLTGWPACGPENGAAAPAPPGRIRSPVVVPAPAGWRNTAAATDGPQAPAAAPCAGHPVRHSPAGSGIRPFSSIRASILEAVARLMANSSSTSRWNTGSPICS